MTSAKSNFNQSPMYQADSKLHQASVDENSYAGLMKRKDSVTDYVSDKGLNFGNMKVRSKRDSIRIDDDDFTKGRHNDSTSSFGGGMQQR